MNMGFYHIWPQSSNLQQIVRMGKYFHFLIKYDSTKQNPQEQPPTNQKPGEVKNVTVGSKSFKENHCHDYII